MTLVQAKVESINTVVAPFTNPVPTIVMTVPPAIGPTTGVTLETVGATTYVNAPVDVTTPPIVVTATSLAPAVPDGVTAVNDVLAPFTTTLVAAAPPTVTLLAPVKFVPVMVISVPAANGPDDGLTLAMVGAAT